MYAQTKTDTARYVQEVCVGMLLGQFTPTLACNRIHAINSAKRNGGYQRLCNRYTQGTYIMNTNGELRCHFQSRINSIFLVIHKIFAEPGKEAINTHTHTQYKTKQTERYRWDC